MSENFHKIVGMQWILEKMTVNGESIDLVPEKPFIKFGEDQTIKGFASINRFFGSLQMDATGQVRWPTPLGSTRMAGPPELMNQENAFLKALPMTERFSQSGIRLYAVSADGSTELVFYVPVE
jgi:heat shock protein HslJ